MTVTYLGEVDRQGKNSLGVRTYTRTFLLETSVQSEGVFNVGSHSSLPVIGSSMPSDPAAYCISLDVKNSNPWKGWTATAEYTTDTQEQSQTGNPVDDTPRVSFSSEIYQEAVFKDTSGNAILNSAGDYFIDPAPTRDVSHLIARIQCNVASVPVWALSYQNAINNAAISINGLAIAEKLAKVQRLEIGEQQLRGNWPFYPVTLEIHIHKDGWNLRPLDAGFRYLDSGELKNIKVNGEDVTQPAPLDGSGAVITAPTPETAVFGDFTIYEELDFSQLPGVS